MREQTSSKTCMSFNSSRQTSHWLVGSSPNNVMFVPIMESNLLALLHFMGRLLHTFNNEVFANIALRQNCALQNFNIVPLPRTMQSKHLTAFTEAIKSYQHYLVMSWHPKFEGCSTGIWQFKHALANCCHRNGHLISAATLILLWTFSKPSWVSWEPSIGHPPRSFHPFLASLLIFCWEPWVHSSDLP